MKKLLIKYLLSFGLSVCLTSGLFSQGIVQNFGAYSITMDSLYTHTGLQNQYLIVYGAHALNDGYGGVFIYDSLSTATEIPFKVIKPTAITTGRWIAVQIVGAGSGDSSIYNNPDFVVINILTIPPGSPSTGDKYLAGIGSGGAWSAQDNDIETWSGSAWTPTVPVKGQLLINGANDDVLKFDGTNWNVITTTYIFHNKGDNYGAINLSIGNKRNKDLRFLQNNIVRSAFVPGGYFNLYYVRDYVSGDSVLTIHNGEVRRAPFSAFSAGASAFTSLTDVPSSYSGQALKLLRVNSGASGLEFFTPTYILPADTTGKWIGVGWLATLAAKQNAITLGTTAQYFRGDLSLATFPVSLPPSGSAGGDLTGTYPNPTVANNAITNAKIANSTIDAAAKLNATGTPSSTTVLYGDNHWGTVSGSSGGSVTKSRTSDSVLQSGAFVYRTQRVFNVRDFGAKGDSITNDRDSIQAAINACFDAGGGIVFFPNGFYRLGGSLVTSGTNIGNPNSLLYLKQNAVTSSLITIEFRAEETANQTFSALAPTYSIQRGGVVLLSDPTSVSGTFPCLLSTDPGSATYYGQSYGVEFKSFGIQYESKNRSGSGPNMSGLNLSKLADVDVEYNSVIIDTPLIYSSFPATETYGIYMPATNNGTLVRAVGNVIGGYKYGMVIAEHFNGDNNEIAACDYGLVVEQTNHGIHIDNIGVHWCRVAISGKVGSITGTGAISNYSAINIDALNTEIRNAGSWFDSRYIVCDSLNMLHGALFYNIVVTGTGYSSTALTKNGGANLYCYSVGDSMNFAKPNATNYWYNPNAGMYQYFNSVNTNPNGFIWQKRGTNKWIGGIDINSANKAYWTLRNVGLNQDAAFFDTTGVIRLGRDASSSTAYGFQVDNGGNATATGSLNVANTSTPSVVLNSTGNAAYMQWQQSGSTKLQIGINFAASTDMYWYDAANGKARLYVNGGVTYLGANAYNAPGMSIDDSKNSTFFGPVSGTSGFDIMAKNDAAGAASSGTLTTYSNGATDATYEIMSNITVASVSGGTVLVQVTWTDESNTSRTKSFFSQGSTTATLSTVDASSFPPMIIRSKASTAITVASVVTGTISYDYGATIKRVRQN